MTAKSWCETCHSYHEAHFVAHPYPADTPAPPQPIIKASCFRHGDHEGEVCPKCSTPAPPVPTQPHDAAAADELATRICDYPREWLQKMYNSAKPWEAEWDAAIDNLDSAYLASREESAIWKQNYADLVNGIEAANKATITALQDRAEAAERDSDALREALLDVDGLFTLIFANSDLPKTLIAVIQTSHRYISMKAALARSAKP